MTSDVAAKPAKPTGPAAEPPGGRAGMGGMLRAGARWETGLVVVLVGVLLYATSESPNFTDASTLFYLGINIGYLAIIALPMTFVIMTGEIDLSDASMLGLSASLVGFLWHHGWGIWPAFVVALVVGALGGALNGVLIARFGLPSIAVTIGTLTLFRGIAEILLGSNFVPGIGDRPFPTWFADVGVRSVPGTQLSWSMLIFIVLAIVFGVVLHFTPLGRAMVAIGLQPEAAEFAGIRVRRTKFWLFVLSGFVSAFAGLLLLMQFQSVTYNIGFGGELTVVAIVLFGGVSIFGGRGTIVGVFLSVAIIGALNMALVQINVSSDKQKIVTGVLLLISVIIPNGADLIRRVRTRFRTGLRTGPG